MALRAPSLTRLVRRPGHVVVAFAVVAFAAVPAAAQTGSGLQISPDGRRTLVSKDVGTERWAITLNADDGTVTGNVFASDGGPPSFVWCTETAHTEDDVTFSCSGAGPCPLTPCPGGDEWSFIATASLPRSFFQPRDEIAPGAAARPLHLPEGGSVQGGVSTRTSGVQPSADGKRTLISKDVGAERWAIVWNPDDHTLTGNVFFPGGGEPRFVWCVERGRDGAQSQLTCHGADRCAAPPCNPDAWTKIADVLLPTSFLEPPDEVDPAELAAAIVGRFGDEEGFEAVLLARDRGYSMRQVVRAALSGRLRDDGTIERRNGGLEPPAGPPLGLLTGGGTAGLASTAADSEVVRLICEQFESSVPASQKVEILTRLLNRGYTLEQLIRVGRGEASISACDGAPTSAEFLACVRANRGDSLVLIDSGGVVEPGEGSEEVLVPEPREGCNRDGRWQPPEECDGGALHDQSCTSFRDSEFVGGELRCDDQCRFDFSGCRRRSICGDGKRDLDEDCDGTDLGGATCETLGAILPGLDVSFTGGVLRCSNEPDGPCVYVTADCLDEPVCGNGRVERGEDCDVGQLRGATCTNIDRFLPLQPDLPDYVGGTVGCITPEGGPCRFDLSQCRERGESVCLDGERDPDEDCDTGDFGDQTCVTRGFVGGELECVRDGDSCRISTDGCRRAADIRCGDGHRDQGEVCDIGDLGGETCASQGFAGGELDCRIPSDPTQPCRLDTRLCTSRPDCGNGKAEGDLDDEECDGRDFRGQTCESLGLGDPRGTLECDPQTCRIDRELSCRQSQKCQNGVAEGDEQCDQDDLRDTDCEDRGFDFGTLACGLDCRFDTSQCQHGCDLGEDSCPDGTCVPAGADCCGGGKYCDVGFVCAGSNSCCPSSLPDLCGPDSCIQAGADCCDSSGAYCDPGTVCTGLGTCCPIDFPQPCGSGCIRSSASCCGGQPLSPGEQCCGGVNPCGSGYKCCGSLCIPIGAQCCGANAWCAPGWVCTEIQGVCCPSTAPKPCAADMTCRPVDAPCP